MKNFESLFVKSNYENINSSFNLKKNKLNKEGY